MNILVTGHLGYIGSVLTRVLHRCGYTVVGLDTGYFADCYISEDMQFPDRELQKDLRSVEVEDLRGIDAIIHLAALSNDPMGELSPALTDEINHLATVQLAQKAREANISRFILSSSCSIYGAANGSAPLTEGAPLNPVSAYAESKIRAEGGLCSLANEHFSPVFLRNATAYGVSPRFRFDLVVNNLVGWALATGNLQVKSDGSPWRPLIHVEDICCACVAALEAPKEAIHAEAFNVGQDSENFQVRDIVKTIRETIPSQVEFTGENQGDSRSYRVSFQKIKDRLPGFRPKWTLSDGIEELYQALREIDLDLFRDRRFSRLDQLQYLMASDYLNTDLFWKGEPEVLAHD